MNGSGYEPPRDRLTTEAPWLPAHTMPSAMSEPQPYPSASRTRTGSTWAPPDNPATPSALPATAATIPATCVPCPFGSKRPSLPSSRSIPGSSRTARSGGLATPVSTTATVRPAAVRNAHVCSACNRSSAHCTERNVSVPTAAARMPVPPATALRGTGIGANTSAARTRVSTATATTSGERRSFATVAAAAARSAAWVTPITGSPRRPTSSATTRTGPRAGARASTSATGPDRPTECRGRHRFGSAGRLVSCVSAAPAGTGAVTARVRIGEAKAAGVRVGTAARVAPATRVVPATARATAGTGTAGAAPDRRPMPFPLAFTTASPRAAVRTRRQRHRRAGAAVDGLARDATSGRRQGRYALRLPRDAAPGGPVTAAWEGQVLLPGYQRPDHSLLRARGRGRGAGLHAHYRGPQRGGAAPADPPGGVRPRRAAVSRRGTAPLRLRAGQARPSSLRHSSGHLRGAGADVGADRGRSAAPGRGGRAGRVRVAGR